MTRKSADELVFLPLGGCGEIGMNLNLYGFGPAGARKWLIADIGVTFGGPDTPGVEIIMPDIEFLRGKEKDILGIVLTHAHEDHMGALARLWPRLRCPIYATPFTHFLALDRLAEAGLDDVPLHEIQLSSRFSLGPFDIELVTLTHSIPEPNALILRTPAGLVLHTGDWKIDPKPQLGTGVDDAALRAAGKEGVLAMVCDSTNVFSPGIAGSEEGVRTELTKLIGEYPDGTIAVASFASNVARMNTVFSAARAHNRSVCLIGRSMHRMYRAAQACDIFGPEVSVISEEEAGALPARHVLYLCTGSQGEPRAALSRIADGNHRTVNLGVGDTVIFSSKIIPGNEKAIFALQNQLADKGIEIITEKMRPIHVSGHPCRDELKQMYKWAQPHIAIPVHGERRHLLEHANLAKSLGVKHALAPHNGEMIQLSKSGAQITEITACGRLHEDCGKIISARDDSLRQRKKMAYNGHIIIGLAIDKKGNLVSGPDPRVSGFPEGKNGELIEKFLDQIAERADRSFGHLKGRERRDLDLVEEKLATSIRRFVREETGKRPIVDVLAHRV